ncbi:1315_t:CDS:1, partial [Funneliformis geosporum]
GYSFHEVASKFRRDIHHTSILRLKQKYNETGSIEDKQASEQPQKLTQKDKCSIV